MELLMSADTAFDCQISPLIKSQCLYPSHNIFVYFLSAQYERLIENSRDISMLFS